MLLSVAVWPNIIRFWFKGGISYTSSKMTVIASEGLHIQSIIVSFSPAGYFVAGLLVDCRLKFDEPPRGLRW